MSRLLNPDESLLLVVDIQSGFVPVIGEINRVIEQTGKLVQACARLEVPVVVSEQYPKGLGHTVPELLAVLPEYAVTLEKTAFGCGGDPAILAHLKATGRKQVMLCGIETHVCVNQTAHQLMAEGFQVHLIEDAVAARFRENHEIAVAKMRQTGVISACVEMALFEMLGNARHACFKELQALIK